MTSASAETRAPAQLRSFEDFYQSTKDKVFRTVFVSIGNFHDAEDATAEAFLKALKNWPRVSKHQAPAAWVCLTARNLHLDSIRRRTKFVSIQSELIEVQNTQPQMDGFDWPLHQALMRLPTRQREIVAMRIILEMSPSEVAAALKITKGSVGTHLHRALGTLRDTLETRNNQNERT